MKILLVALLSIGMSLASPRPDQCNILRASPFMASTLSGDLKNRSGIPLHENLKSSSQKTLVKSGPNNHGNQHNHDHPAFDVEVEEDTLSNVVNSSAVLTQGIANVLTESTGSVLPSNIWNYLCIATWYPLHEERCKETRCTVCAPAIMSAAAACEKARGKITHICVQRVMGEGSCNYCIGDFMN
ncbi:unnamed protein product [Lepeophtheirus salmonis]|uniref:(salmon louse) hypothetical protein n=1 Tax=Lepeophtheirus salmonis TaxID=72036 RepID=A0A7R8H572_LEPSM|nr:unnamed protein product [Lepeophtheirus salmonis]CAF2862440.1 unnamed protein product [Lepeophtheirus salmonis]